MDNYRKIRNIKFKIKKMNNIKINYKTFKIYKIIQKNQIELMKITSICQICMKIR